MQFLAKIPIHVLGRCIEIDSFPPIVGNGVVGKLCFPCSLIFQAFIQAHALRDHSLLYDQAHEVALGVSELDSRILHGVGDFTGVVDLLEVLGPAVRCAHGEVLSIIPCAGNGYLDLDAVAAYESVILHDVPPLGSASGRPVATLLT